MVNLSPKTDIAIDNLSHEMKRKKYKKNLRESLSKTLKQTKIGIQIKGKKLLLTKDFFTEYVKINKLDDSKTQQNNEQYNFFVKLKKHGLIHQDSSYFPKRLSLININPNASFVFKANLSDVDGFLNAISTLYKEEKDLIQDVYNDLRLFQLKPLAEKEILSIDTQNIIILNDNMAVIYFEQNNLFASKITSYYLIPIHGIEMINFFQMGKTDGQNRPFIEKEFETKFQGFKNDHFGKLHISYLKMLNQNELMLRTSPVSTVINTGRNILSTLNLAEINYLYPHKVPPHLLEIEQQLIQESLKRPTSFTNNEDENNQESEFSLKNFEQLETLRKTPLAKKSEFMKQKHKATNELNKYLKSITCKEHDKLIVEYVLYLISRTDSGNTIRISTFKNYLGSLDKHLFRKINDLSHIQHYELQTIFNDLRELQYKKKSILKIRSLIMSFFSFHSKKHHLDLLSIVSYPKSLVFYDELDEILNAIEHDEKKQQNLHRIGKRVQFSILQKQALVILAFYFGLRRGELRSRLISDIYLSSGKLCIDVNKNGAKKCKINLKTSNAIRRICELISNKNHLNILKQFWKLRRQIPNKSPFVFLEVDNDYTIRSKPVTESVFDEISEIIQAVTNRYTSFHSLRHSFVSYQSLSILNNNDSNIYDFINLSSKVGHQSPEISMKIYAHASLLLLDPKKSQ